MGGNLGGPTLLVIVFLVLLLFGAPKLPALAKSLGQSMKILKKEVSGDNSGDDSTGKSASTADTPAAPSAPTPPAAPTAPPVPEAAPEAPATPNPEPEAPNGESKQ